MKIDGLGVFVLAIIIALAVWLVIAFEQCITWKAFP
jgi:hypothetical protein